MATGTILWMMYSVKVGLQIPYVCDSRVTMCVEYEIYMNYGFFNTHGICTLSLVRCSRLAVGHGLNIVA